MVKPDIFLPSSHLLLWCLLCVLLVLFDQVMCLAAEWSEAARLHLLSSRVSSPLFMYLSWVFLDRVCPETDGCLGWFLHWRAHCSNQIRLYPSRVGLTHLCKHAFYGLFWAEWVLAPAAGLNCTCLELNAVRISYSGFFSSWAQHLKIVLKVKGIFYLLFKC